MTPVLASLLLTMRQHEGFPELLRSVEKPKLPVFHPKRDAEKVETSRAKWIFASGEQAQHQAWLSFLTGQLEDNND